MKRGGGGGGLEKNWNMKKLEFSKTLCIFSKESWPKNFSKHSRPKLFSKNSRPKNFSKNSRPKIFRKIHDQKFSEKITPKNFLEKNHDQTFSRKNHDLLKFFQFSSFQFFSISPRNEKGGGARENFFVLHGSLHILSPFFESIKYVTKYVKTHILLHILKHIFNIHILCHRTANTALFNWNNLPGILLFTPKKMGARLLVPGVRPSNCFGRSSPGTFGRSRLVSNNCLES